MHFFKVAATLALATQAFSTCVDTPDQTPLITTASPITPSVISQWFASSVKYNVTFGLISVYNGQSSSSSLLTFDFPSGSKGKTCQFNLYLGRCASVCPSGSAPTNGQCSGTFALYSSLKPAAPNARSNNRFQWIDVLKAQTANNAAWVEPSSTPVKVPCPVGTAGFELVPQGDFDYIYMVEVGFVT